MSASATPDHIECEVESGFREAERDVATRSMSEVAAGWDRRLAAIRRIAEASVKSRGGKR
jgi:hypothetical protein